MRPSSGRRAGDLPLRARRDERRDRPLGGAARWWLAQSLRALKRSLRARGAALVLRRGTAAEVIAELARADRRRRRCIGTTSPGAARAVADEVAAALAEIGVAVAQLPRRSAGGRRQASATRRAAACACSRRSGGGCGRSAIRRQPLPAPTKLCGPAPAFASDRLDDWELEPTAPDWAGGLRESWTAGRSGGAARLQTSSTDDIAGYAGDRDRPDRDGTSRLSPHLRFGEISPRQVWHAARFAAAERPAIAGDIEKFLSELGWREFCRHLLFDHPDLADPQSAAGVRRLPLDARRRGLASLAARPDRLSDRRCRHARALAHRRDAQPGAHGGGLVPGQASADRLARRRAMVLGHAGRCRRRQQSGQLAMGGGLRRRCRALFPRLQSDPAGREVRSRRRLCPALGARTGATAGDR